MSRSDEMRILIDDFKKHLIKESNLNAIKKSLGYEFKCTDADEDGVFYHTPFGEIDTTEFAQFIDDMEEHEITYNEFINKFKLTELINKIIDNSEKEWLQFFDKSNESGYVVIFDGDTHFIFSVT